MMMAVSFERYGRLYYLDPGPYQPVVGSKVLVPTDAGPEVAECVWVCPPRGRMGGVGGRPVGAAPAPEPRGAGDEETGAKRARAGVPARRLTRKHALPMKVVGVDYVGGPPVFTVYFSAPHRVDFRALVRDLASRLSGREELRQGGPRGEARLPGGRRDRWRGPVRWSCREEREHV